MNTVSKRAARGAKAPAFTLTLKERANRANLMAEAAYMAGDCQTYKQWHKTELTLLDARKTLFTYCLGNNPLFLN